MKSKKFLYDFSLANIIATIVFGVFVFFSIFNIKDSLTISLISALVLCAISSALNGVLLGGISSTLSLLGAMIYKINYQPAPVFKATKKMIEKLGKEAAEAKALLRLENYKQILETLNKNMIFIFLGAVVLAFIGRYLFLKVKASSVRDSAETKNLFSAKSLSYLSMFIALSVILNTLRVGSISFGGFPIIYSGMALGPVYGFIVGLVSDLLGFLVRPSSNAFNLAFTLTSALTGAIPVIVLKLIGKEKEGKTNFVKVLIAILVGQTITSVILVPYFMKLFYGFNFIERFIKALSKQIWSIPLYAFVFVATWKVISKQVDFDKIKKDNKDFAIPAK